MCRGLSFTLNAHLVVFVPNGNQLLLPFSAWISNANYTTGPNIPPLRSPLVRVGEWMEKPVTSGTACVGGRGLVLDDMRLTWERMGLAPSCLG